MLLVSSMFAVCVCAVCCVHVAARSRRGWLPCAMSATSARPYYLSGELDFQTGWMCECDFMFMLEHEFVRHRCRWKQGPWLMATPEDERRLGLEHKRAIFKTGGESLSLELVLLPTYLPACPCISLHATHHPPFCLLQPV